MIAFTNINDAEAWLTKNMRGDTSILQPAGPWPVTRWTFRYSETHKTWTEGFRHTILPNNYLRHRVFRVAPEFIEAFVARLEHYGHAWESYPLVRDGKTLWSDIRTDATLDERAFPCSYWLLDYKPEALY